MAADAAGADATDAASSGSGGGSVDGGTIYGPDGEVLNPTALRLPVCADMDEDGFGMNCARGIDCDDNNPRVTDECYRCARPATGCACSAEGTSAACNADTDADTPTIDGVCNPGLRFCESGRWTNCRRLGGSTRIVTPPTTCGSACNPECRQQTTCVTGDADIGTRGVAVQVGTMATPGFCPAGGPTTGGIQLNGGLATVPPEECSSSCGGACCRADETCFTYTDMSAYPPSCTALGSAAPPPVRVSVCARSCPAGRSMCGQPPFMECCDAATEACIESRCVPRLGTCDGSVCQMTGNANDFNRNNYLCRGRPTGGGNYECASGFYCDVRANTCVRLDAGNCQQCRGYTNSQRCMERVVTNGGQAINGIFRTANGNDARTLRFATYYSGTDLLPNGHSCLYGTSPNPVNCGSFTCEGRGGNAADLAPAQVGTYANGLDWRYMWSGRMSSVRSMSSGGSLIGDGNSNHYNPWDGIKFDLGAPANRVVMFPTTDHVSDSCLEPFEYTVYLTDNPGSRQIAPAGTPDPNMWNRAVLTQVFTQGWTRNPRATGSVSDTSDLESTAYGDATADAMVTVWALPCGFNARYVSILAGNAGNPGPECTFHSFDAEFDAVAGLSVEGNSLSIYHRLPYGSTAGPDSLQFSTRVRSADVYFLFDTTGSMGGELNNLKSSLTGAGGIISRIRDVIPDIEYGVGQHDDFPVDPYGDSWSGDIVYRNRQNISSSESAAQTAVNALSLHYGNDWPESQLMALHSSITGNGLGSYLNAAPACPGGRFGYPCFRVGAIPIIMLFTDAPFHNGPQAWTAYDNATLGITPPTYGQVVDALNARGAKVIIVDSSGESATGPSQSDERAIANATGSLIGGGTPAVYSIGWDGTGLSDAVVQGIADLANYSRMDVTAVALDNPATGSVDERCFIDPMPGTPIGTVRLSDPLLGESAPYAAGRCTDPPSTSSSGYPIMARQCLPGTPVNFRARFRNNCVMSTNTDQIFQFNIVVLGNGTYELGRIPVTIVVPKIVYPEKGYYTDTIDGIWSPTNTAGCQAGRVPDWNSLQFVSDTPTGTSIDVHVLTANTASELDAQAAANRWIYTATIPPASSPIPIGPVLTAANISNRLSLLRVRFTLNANTDRTRTPTINGYRVLFNCVDGS